MTVVSIVIGLLLSIMDPSTGNSEANSSTPEAAAAQTQSSDYIVCDDYHP